MKKTKRIKDIQIDTRFIYDGDTCFNLYLQYFDDKISLEEFVLYLKRYVVMRVRKRYYQTLRADVCEDLVQTVLLELFQVARKKKLPTKSVQVFHAFMNTIIRCNISKGFKSIYDDSPKNMDPTVYIEHQMKRIPGVDEAETRLFLMTLNDDIRNSIVESLRWDDPNSKDAADYVCRRILEEKRIVLPLLKRVFRIQDPVFFADHIRVKVRLELEKAKQSITIRSDTMKREILHAGIAEYFVER